MGNKYRNNINFGLRKSNIHFLCHLIEDEDIDESYNINEGFSLAVGGGTGDCDGFGGLSQVYWSSKTVPWG